MTALADLQAQDYRLGDCQAIRYDRTRADLFSDGYLGRLYFLLKECGRHGGDGILTAMFGGNPPSAFDAIIPFLAARPLIVLGTWKGGQFTEAGLCYPILYCGTQQTEMAAFCGFGFLPPVWGSDELCTLGILGLAMLYQELNLVAIHGTRFPANMLAARFMEQFGFHTVGELPHYQLQEGKLVPAVIATCSRETFETVAAAYLRSFYPPEGPKSYQTAEESSLRLLRAGEVKAVWFPVGTKEIPPLPEGMRSCIVDGGFHADGIWYYNPGLVTEVEIWIEAGNDRHAALLAPRPQAEVIAEETPKKLTLRVTRGDGSLVTKLTVPATAQAIETACADFPHFAISVDHGEPDPEQKEEKPGSSGGKARAAKLSPEERRDSARRAARARWNKPQAEDDSGQQKASQ